MNFIWICATRHLLPIVTLHQSPVTRHPPPAEKSCRVFLDESHCIAKWKVSLRCTFNSGLTPLPHLKPTWSFMSEINWLSWRFELMFRFYQHKYGTKCWSKKISLEIIVLSKRRLKMEISFRFISSLLLIPLAQSQQISSFDFVETNTFDCEFSYRIRKYACLSISYSFNLSRKVQLWILFFEVTIKFRSCRKIYPAIFFHDKAVAQWTAIITLKWEDSNTQLLMELLPQIMTPVCHLPYATTWRCSVYISVYMCSLPSSDLLWNITWVSLLTHWLHPSALVKGKTDKAI